MTSSCILGFQATQLVSHRIGLILFILCLLYVGESIGESQSISQANKSGLQTQQCPIRRVARKPCRGRFNTVKRATSRASKSGYNYNFLEEQFLRAANISCTNALQTKPKASNDVVPFVVTYNPALPRISNILRKHFNILHSSNRWKDVFKQPLFVAYRPSPNLRDILVKAQLPVISSNHFPPGSFRCGQNCATCPYITNGLRRYTFYATGETTGAPNSRYEGRV